MDLKTDFDGLTVVSESEQPLSLTRCQLPWQVRFASWRFGSARGLYYEDLATTLEAQMTGRSLLELFQNDAQRAKASSARSVLAHWWANRYLLTGGNLAQTFQGTLPQTDVICLAMTQTAGQQAMISMLKHMAQRTRQMAQSRRDFLMTTLSGLIAWLVSVFVLTVLPLYTGPQLMAVFGLEGEHPAGSWTRALMNWVQCIERYAIWVVVLMAALCAFYGWSRYHWVGAKREKLDQWGFYKRSREYETLCFLSLTSTLMQTLGVRGVSLCTILNLQLNHARPWLRQHLMRMVSAMELGVESIQAMDTGLFEADLWNEMQCGVRVHGLTFGFSRCADQVLSQLTRRLRRQSVFVRWCLLLVSLVVVLFMAYWHVRVFEELRQFMMLSFSVQS